MGRPGKLKWGKEPIPVKTPTARKVICRNKRKTQTAWAIKTPDGKFWTDPDCQTEKDVWREFCDNNGIFIPIEPWNMCTDAPKKHESRSETFKRLSHEGYRCVKIEIREVGNDD